MLSKSMNIKIVNNELGEIVNENFVNDGQFKLFLMSIHSSLELRESLTFFNGETFLLHIPYNILKDSVIMTKETFIDITEQIKSKLEAIHINNEQHESETA